MIIFDIETEPLPIEKLQDLMPPFDETAVPGLVTGEFDPNSVKTGNVKDPAKIAEKIEQARQSHEAAKANTTKLVEEARAKQTADFLDRAALSPVTGRVLVVGYYATGKEKLVIDDGKGEEAAILQGFWTQYQRCRAGSRSMVGLNIHEFDLPFLVRRSWIRGIDVPATVIDQHRFWDRVFVDLRKVWLLGQYGTNCPSSFDLIGKALGTGGKNGDGADFARLWREDREAAIAYLANDLKQPAAWAERMGVMA